MQGKFDPFIQPASENLPRGSETPEFNDNLKFDKIFRKLFENPKRENTNIWRSCDIS
jgi:hypothetical protein